MGVHVAFAYGFLMGLTTESAHYRGIFINLHSIFYVIKAYSVYRTPNVDATALIPLATISTVGSIVHAMEPGIFTKDKKGKSA